MNISNLVGQYSQSSSAKTEKLTGKKGVENLSSSVKSLTRGHVFEGTVSSMKNGRVTLALSNGTQISARLDGKISLSVGQSMFFQVKSNEGSQIAIRPYMENGSGINLTLMQALSAAGLPAEENYLAMVNKMMEEQMPIDRASLQQMSRLVNSNSGIDVQTVVQLNKLGIPITMENAVQFENYLGDKQAITDAFDELIDLLPETMKGSGMPEEELRQMNSQVLSIVTEGLPQGENAENAVLPADNPLFLAAERTAADALLADAIPAEGEAAAAGASESGGAEASADGAVRPNGEGAVSSDAPGASGVQPDGAPGQSGAAEAAQPGVSSDGELNGKTAAQPGAPADGAARADGNAGEPAGSQAQTGASGTQAGASSDGAGQTAAQQGAAAGQGVFGADGGSMAARPEGVEITLEAFAVPAQEEHTLGALLDAEQLADLNEQLGRLVGQDRVDYPPKQEAAALLDDLQQLLRSEYPIDRDSLQRLFSSVSFKRVVKDALEQQWTIKPEKLSDSDQINKLYEKQNSQMSRMADVLKATGQESASFARMASDIRGNVDFMNQINQIYSYVQIPLKLSGQSASGELYVYTNKKALSQQDKDLTAFLHLDLEHLGATDVSVRMRGREVSTNFYMEDDAAYDLLERHLPVLEERLRSKGYNCKISVKNEAKHVNFVEDFLKKEKPSAGQLHRYSFDMRA